MLRKDKFLYVEWIITFGCNYTCNYCFYGYENLRKHAYMFRQRGPRLPKSPLEEKLFPLARKLGIFKYADSIRNYPLARWLGFFDYVSEYRRDLYLSLTGGEPFLLRREIGMLLRHLSEKFETLKVRVDTNGSIIPSFGAEFKSYLSFNVSYHPTQVSRDELLKNLDALSASGEVLMVNRVVGPTEMVGILDEIEYFRRRGYYLNVNPTDFNLAEYSPEARKVLSAVRSEIDVSLPMLGQTAGRSCEYPSLGMQLLPSGYAWVPPCDGKKAVEVIRNPSNFHKLLKTEPFICPGKCVCFHQYPWVAGGYSDVDIMKQFVERNKQWRETHLQPHGGEVVSRPASVKATL